MNKEEFKSKVDEKANDLKWKLRLKAEQAKNLGRDAVAWGMNHPAEAVGIIGGTATLIGGINKIGRRREKRREEKEKATRVYDNRTGSYVYLRKPLTQNQQVMLATRQMNGESTTLILKSMGVLKR